MLIKMYMTKTLTNSSNSTSSNLSCMGESNNADLVVGAL